MRDKVIYIAGKYSDNDPLNVEENIDLAREYALALWEMGYTAICPHLNTANFEDDSNCKYDDFLDGDLELIKRSDALFMLPNWTESFGACREREHAISLDKKIFYDLNDLENWNLK